MKTKKDNFDRQISIIKLVIKFDKGMAKKMIEDLETKIKSL